jgi:hypothetical protein
MARVDPHFIDGAEVSLGNMPRHLKLLEDVQLGYLRRFLRLPDRSMKTILFSETGLLFAIVVLSLLYTTFCTL